MCVDVRDAPSQKLRSCLAVGMLHRAMAAALSAILEEQSGLELLTPDGETSATPMRSVTPQQCAAAPSTLARFAIGIAACAEPGAHYGM